MVDRILFSSSRGTFCLRIRSLGGDESATAEVWRRVPGSRALGIVTDALERDQALRRVLQAHVRQSLPWGAEGLDAADANDPGWRRFLSQELSWDTFALYENIYRVARIPVPEVVEEEPAPPTEVDWIGFSVADELGDPVPNLALEVILPNDVRRLVYTNAAGIANVQGVPPGKCRVTVVGTYGEAWEMK